MANPTCLIQRSVDRPNIFLSVHFMSSINAYSELDYLIPQDVQSASDIPKTIVFVDNRKIVWDLTTYLLDRIDATYSGHEFLGLVRDYSTIMSLEHRNNVLEDFAEGSVRILICTEAAGMGVDIPDVRRVVQWGAPTFINLSTIWQRMGRAGRSSKIQAVFTFFAQRSMRVMPVDPLEIYRSPIKENDPRSKAIMKEIVSFEEQTDELAETFGANAISNFDEEVSVGLSTAEIQEEAQPLLLHQMPRKGFKKKDTRLSYDRGILTLAATTGCLRSLFIRYFDTEAKPLPSANHCCAGCAEKSQIVESIRCLLPSHFFDGTFELPEREIEDNNDDSDDEGDDDNPDADGGFTTANTIDVDRGRPGRGRPTPKWLAIAALNAIYAFRDQIWLADIPTGIPKELSGLGPQSYLSHTEIQSISKGILGIRNPQDICAHLKTKMHYHLAPIAPHVASLVEECQRIVRDTPAPPPPPRRMLPPVSRPTPKKTYDPIKRHEYYIRARDKKRAALSELSNTTPSPLSNTIPAPPDVTKRKRTASELPDQENETPRKARLQ